MRQVDVKALVSHVIRGDGVNKCRICMGDTSEGQVHLNDVVLMEGDKPVTLTELLEIVTGIQVPLEDDLPAGVCLECVTCAINAANFRSMCRQTFSKWDVTLQLLYDLPSQNTEKNKKMFAMLDDKQMIIVIDENELNLDTPSERLANHLITLSDKNREWEEEMATALLKCTEEDHKESHSISERDILKNSEREEGMSTALLKCKEEDHEKSNSISEHDKLDAASESIENDMATQSQKNTESVKVAQCPNCDKKFLRPLQMYHHLKGSTDMKRACQICSEVMSRDELVSHLMEAHNIKVFDCKKCPALLLTSNMYSQHLTKAHSRGACTCVDCGRTFRTSQAFHSHLSVHRQKCCPGCDKIFRNQSCFAYHIKKCLSLNKNRDIKTETKMRVDDKTEHSKRNVRVGALGSIDEEYICDYCGKKFAKKKYVSAHIQIVHMKNTHGPCAYCGKFLATAHMTEHIKKHEIDLSFTCEHCGIVLKTKLGYVQHLRLHTGERPYACEICKETFSASSRRSEHMRKVHKGPDVLNHACKLCPAKFRLPYKLKKHMHASHIKESDETLQFECSECHEKFGSCRGLLHHSRKHQKVQFPHKKPEKSIMLKVFSETNCDD